MASIRALFIVTIVLFFVPVQAEQLSLKHYLDWEQAGNPQVSPDGKRILFSRTRVNKVTDGFDTEVWQMDADGSRQRFLLNGGAATWSPSGDRVAYIAPANGKAQLFVRWMDAEGAVSQITWDTVEPKDFKWSPDGKWIAFRAEVPMKPAMSIELPPRPPGAKWTEDPPVIDKLHYRTDRIGMKTGYNHLFVVPASGGTPRQLTEGNWDVGRHFFGMDAEGNGSMSWTADSGALVFSAVMDEDDESGGYNSGIHKVNVASGEISTLVDAEGSWGSALVSPDGRHIVFVSDRSGKPQLYLMELATGNTQRLTFEGVENAEPCWSPSENLVVYSSLRGGIYQLATIDPFKVGSSTQITSDQTHHESPSWSPDGNQIIFAKRDGKGHKVYGIMKNGLFQRNLFSLPGSQTYPRWAVKPY